MSSGKKAQKSSGRVPKCHIYIRVSHSDQLEGVSMERQAHDGWQFYERMIAPLGVERGEVFEEKAVSAFKVPFMERPEGKRLNLALQPGDHIVFLRLDRAFRRLRDMANTCPIWLDRGVNVHFISPNINLSTAQGKLVAHVIAAVVEWESAMKSERLREAAAYKRMRYPMQPYSTSPKTARKWVKPRKIKDQLVYVSDKDRFEEAMLGLRVLSTGSTFTQAAQAAESKRREVMGLPPKAKFLDKPFWTEHVMRQLAQKLPGYLQVMRNYYGERDEYYLNLTPVVRKEGRQILIPPIPRPVDEDDTSLE